MLLIIHLSRWEHGVNSQDSQRIARKAPTIIRDSRWPIPRSIYF